MVIGRLIPWRSVAVASSVMLALAAVAGAVHAQGGATVHIQVANGSHAGTFDVDTAERCVVSDDTANPGAQAWQLTFDQDTSDPSGFTLRTGYGADLLSVVWSNGDYTTTTFDLEPFEGEGAVALNIAGTLDAGYYSAADDPDPVDVGILVECHDLVDLRSDAATAEPVTTPATVVLPTPQVQGPPAPGSTVIDLTLDFGPWAGSYRSWTLDEACSAGDGSWIVWFEDPMALPGSVSLVAAEADGEDPAIGTVTAMFSGSGITLYQTSGEAVVEPAGPGSIRISDARAVAALPDGSEAYGHLEATATCGAEGS